MQTFFLFIYTLVWGLYGIGVWILIMGWLRLKTYSISADFQAITKVSILIAARNEELHLPSLLQDLETQTYPFSHFEVIIVDDASEDATPLVLASWEKKTSFHLKIIRLEEDEHILARKKYALSEAQRYAKGDLILHTDADCRLLPTWIETLVSFYQQEKPLFISSAVRFDEEKTLFEKLQTVEFASLVATGAACIQLGFPTMCNGANLGYPTFIFREVKGYEDIMHNPSGDDEMLMHKIKAYSPHHIRFCKSPENVVSTHAQASLKAFLQQRLRWASKWNQKSNSFFSQILAIFIFLVHLLTLLFPIVLGMTEEENKLIFFVLLLSKNLSEFVFLSLVLIFLKKANRIWVIPLVQCFHSLYVVWIGMMANQKRYEWKNRKIVLPKS